MKQTKSFDCVRMKGDVQRQLQRDWSHLTGKQVAEAMANYFRNSNSELANWWKLVTQPPIEPPRPSSRRRRKDIYRGNERDGTTYHAILIRLLAKYPRVHESQLVEECRRDRIARGVKPEAVEGRKFAVSVMGSIRYYGDDRTTTSAKGVRSPEADPRSFDAGRFWEVEPGYFSATAPADAKGPTAPSRARPR